MVRLAGKLCASLSAIIPLLASVAIAPAQAADQPEAKYHATREDIGTKIMWVDDNLNPGDPGARLESYFPLPLVNGGRAAEIVKLSPGPLTIEFSFEIHFNSSFVTDKNHVRPSAVVEYKENNETKYLAINYDDFTRTSAIQNRQRWTYTFNTKLGKPLDVQRIGIGGKELSARRVGRFPMDVTIYRFRVFRESVPSKRSYDLDVKVVAPNSDGFLQRINGTTTKDKD